MNHFRKPFACVVGLMLVAAVAANADTIYTYTGNEYGSGASGDFTASEFIAASFTFAAPLPDGLSATHELSGVLSWTINDGQNSFSSADSSDSLEPFALGTGPSGAITAWFFNVTGPDGENLSSTYGVGFGKTEVASNDDGSAGENANPDGWTITTTPEPSTLVSMALGLAVMLFAVRRRIRLAARA
jgi:hypothetical protein